MVSWFSAATRAFHVHHVVHRQHGGSDDPRNLELRHTTCHRSFMQAARTEQTRGPRGPLEPCAATSGMHGSEGAGASQGAPATRPWSSMRTADGGCRAALPTTSQNCSNCLPMSSISATL
ncbi:HNH endonuclease [Streptomyces violascens]|uniref:HNH endonuclease n=1 Tax=Streptomyces violascens TaxID=67381 RepID=UPI001CFD6F2A